VGAGGVGDTSEETERFTWPEAEAQLSPSKGLTPGITRAPTEET
jgi:hypothetical protein